MSLITAAAIALVVPPAPPPPIVHTPPSGLYTVPRARIINLVPGEASCDGKPVKPLHTEAPLPGRSYGELTIPPASLTFRIGEDGRPMSIAFDGERQASGRVEYNDLQPAFAAWRFAAGEARSACRITFTPRSVDAEDADPAIAFRYATLVTSNRPNYDVSLSRALYDRARGPGSDCSRRPEPRRISYPDYDRVPQAPGGLSFVMLNYDVDRSGKPVDVEVVGSNGNLELNHRAVEAIRDSRFKPAARRGCVHSFYRNPAEPLPAPAGPSAQSLQPANAQCPREESEPWKRLPRLVFPDNFQRRSIEGWAILRYDVAPWGQVGNVRVLAAEPASQFGESAVNVIANALKRESSRGYSGCVERVVFKIEPRADAADD